MKSELCIKVCRSIFWMVIAPTSFIPKCVFFFFFFFFWEGSLFHQKVLTRRVLFRRCLSRRVVIQKFGTKFQHSEGLLFQNSEQLPFGIKNLRNNAFWDKNNFGIITLRNKSFRYKKHSKLWPFGISCCPTDSVKWVRAAVLQWSCIVFVYF